MIRPILLLLLATNVQDGREGAGGKLPRGLKVQGAL